MTKNQIQGLVVTIVAHALVVLLLLMVKLSAPLQEEESGIPVMLGNSLLAQGHTESYQYTEVSSVKSDVPNVDNAPLTQPQPQVDEPLITQPDEPTVEVPTAEELEARKRAEAERLAAERAAQQMASAFGKGFEMGSKGEATEKADEGTQGIETGVAAADKAVGVGVQGTFDLNGRSLSGSGLPVPVNTVQDEGRVVVNITVNPAGQVIATSINRRTNTVNPELRKAAEDAARKARFNAIEGVDNQSGTITYYFKLR
ncbi:MAG: TonB family protein [Bacteroidaceae bacterium]|nr:TonB family protein [Bacteroidaceae bacterium]MBR4041085.1 TonB family protein [Bacteroidaceae bacterium]